MNNNYHGDSTLLSDAFKAMCDKKLAKLEKLADDISVEIFLSKEGKEHILKMVASSKNWEVVSREKSDDMYKNIDLCIDSLRKQINDKKPAKSQSKIKKDIDFAE